MTHNGWGPWWRPWLAALLAMVVTYGTAAAQGPPQPWLEPQDTRAALFEPDRYAWQLFVALNWPAMMESREADPTKAFGAEGPVVWEAWRPSNLETTDAVFQPAGADPGPWLANLVVASRSIGQFSGSTKRRIAAMRRAAGSTPPGVVAAPVVDGQLVGRDEMRWNKAAFEFLRAEKLYNFDTIAAKFTAGVKTLNFPPMTKLTKARWRKITDAEKPRYHWAEVIVQGGAKEAWGLVGFHITTKDTPNWFWATFEHIDTRTVSANQNDPEANEGWLAPTVDRLACPVAPHDCAAAPAGIGLEGTKWANYRLRGTQVDFMDSWGAPTRLSNSKIEQGLQDTSCITCHAAASLNAEQGSRGETHELGAPKPEWFRDAVTGELKYTQTDFVWSLNRAQRATPLSSPGRRAPPPPAKK